MQGGLPLTYRLGSGATVHLKLDIDYSIKPVYDVTASIPGSTHPDEVVQLGAHHDAWTYGSDDNLSGAESVLQIGRGLAKLLATGWRPARTIELGTWDGEEYGLFGSTEYAEDAGRSRLGHVVAYLNMDIAAGQDFGASVRAVDGRRDPRRRQARAVAGHRTAPRTTTGPRTPGPGRADARPAGQRVGLHRVPRPLRRPGRRHRLVHAER